LEKRVKELEGEGRSESMERVLKRNQELEDEIEKLRAQLELQSELHSSVRHVGWGPSGEEVIAAHIASHQISSNILGDHKTMFPARTPDILPSPRTHQPQH
jgi:hypothetical protein